MSPSSATPVCPITGTPLRSGQTISLEAAEQLASRCNDLSNLLDIASQVVAGAGASPAPARTQPHSKPPLNLGLLAAVDEWRDLINEWATAYLAWAKPGVRLRPGDWYQVQNLLTGKTVPLAKMTRYPEAPGMYEAISQAVKNLKRLVRWDPKTWIPLGPCPNCERPVFAPLGDPATQCRGCAAIIDVEARKVEVRQDIGSLWLTRSAAREAARVYAGADISRDRLDQWVRRGKITPIRSADGLLYNVGHLIEQANHGEH